MSTSLLSAECFAFKSQESGKFVRYMREHQRFKGILHVSGEHTRTPYARFHPEPSMKHDGYYHIKSLYNDKYWVANKVNNGWYIFVDANVPEEDISNPSCTLFRIELHSDSCEIFHGHTRGGVTISDASRNTLEGCLLVGNGNEVGFTFKLISMPSRFVLPEYVSFKGDNDQYLRVSYSRGNYFLQFSASDRHDPNAIHSIETNEDGTIRIRNHMVDKYWRMNGWIRADSSDTTSDDLNTVFIPCKFGDMVALKSLGNNKFCKRLTDYWENCLNACVDTITNEAMLRVEEPIRSRRISGLEYHFEDSKVSSEEVILETMVTDVNRTSQSREHEIPIEYTVKEERMWGSSTTWKLGGQLTISAGFPKVGVNAELQVHTELEKSRTWGTNHAEEKKSSYHFKGTVPKNKKVKVNLIMSKGKCDVPFSYIQVDVRADGTTVTYKYDDGLFRGVNCLNVYAKAIEEDP